MACKILSPVSMPSTIASLELAAARCTELPRHGPSAILFGFRWRLCDRRDLNRCDEYQPVRPIFVTAAIKHGSVAPLGCFRFENLIVDGMRLMLRLVRYLPTIVPAAGLA